jgi:hypothetical protein
MFNCLILKAEHCILEFLINCMIQICREKKINLNAKKRKLLYKTEKDILEMKRKEFLFSNQKTRKLAITANIYRVTTHTLTNLIKGTN